MLYAAHRSGRFIPAGAGNGSRRVPSSQRPSVHPRGCGERDHAQRVLGQEPGSSPRVRGTGLASRSTVRALRFIPAGAGNGSRRVPSSQRPSVHPRGCGERDHAQRVLGQEPGSSPRVRGTGLASRSTVRALRFIPAGAGNGGRSARRDDEAAVHPRGCGERFTTSRFSVPKSGSSPRVRGTGPVSRPHVRNERFIPAGAGNGPARLPTIRGPAVHPRGCGERRPDLPTPVCKCGSSPRVRGTVDSADSLTPALRFIPAGAGNGRSATVRIVKVPVHPRGCGERESWTRPLP